MMPGTETKILRYNKSRDENSAPAQTCAFLPPCRPSGRRDRAAGACFVAVSLRIPCRFRRIPSDAGRHALSDGQLTRGCLYAVLSPSKAGTAKQLARQTVLLAPCLSPHFDRPRGGSSFGHKRSRSSASESCFSCRSASTAARFCRFRFDHVASLSAAAANGRRVFLCSCLFFRPPCSSCCLNCLSGRSD